MSDEIDLRGSLEGVTFVTPLYVLELGETPTPIQLRVIRTYVRERYGEQIAYDAQIGATCLWVPCRSFKGRSAATVYIKEDTPEAIEKASELVLNLCYAMRKESV